MAATRKVAPTKPITTILVFSTMGLMFGVSGLDGLTRKRLERRSIFFFATQSEIFKDSQDSQTPPMGRLELPDSPMGSQESVLGVGASRKVFRTAT